MNVPVALRFTNISRRHFLRGAGVALALPFLDSLQPRSARAADSLPPRRMLLISNNLGVLPKPFFPQVAGRDYQLSPYLTGLAEFRNDFTVFSGLSHPGVVGGHSTENCFLTSARGPTKSGFRNQISLDQLAAEKLGPVTRFPTLNLGVNIDKANRSLSWTRDGVLLPAEDRASVLFQRMFIQGDANAVQRQLHRLEERESILIRCSRTRHNFAANLVAMTSHGWTNTSILSEKLKNAYMQPASGNSVPSPRPHNCHHPTSWTASSFLRNST